MSQICPVPISYLNVVHCVRALQLKVCNRHNRMFWLSLEITCEVNVDDVALRSLDGLPLVKVIGVVGRIVRRCHHSASWEAFGFLWQNTWHQAQPYLLIINHLKLPGAPQAFCPETEPLSEGLFPSSEVFIQHFDTLLCKTKIDDKSYQLSIWCYLGL